jgi:hypothetical protein
MPEQIPEDAGFTPPLFTAEQVHALADFVEAHGKARARHQGSEFSEVDYLAGAMSMFFALKLQDKMPAGWIFSTFAGRSPLGITVPDRQVYVVMAGKLRQPVAVYANRHIAQEHVEHLWRQGDDVAFVATETARTALPERVAASIEAHYAQEEQSLT